MIRAEIEDHSLWVYCPVARKHSQCVLPAKDLMLLQSKMMEWGWPKKYVKQARWKMCRAETVLRAWLKERMEFEGLLLHGPVGTGKTMAATLIAREMWPEKRSRFASWPHLTESLAEGRHGLDALIQAPMLVLDDFGVGSIAPWVLGRLDMLFEMRQSFERPTIVTTNLTPKTLQSEPDWERFVDRWRETMTAVTVPGASQRTGGRG